jgi:hypothetical protein
MFDRIEQRSSPCRHRSREPKLSCGISRPLSCVISEHWALPGRRKWFQPELWVLLRDYCITDDKRSKHPGTLGCVGLATATLYACHLIHLGILVVGCHARPMMQSYYSIDLLEDAVRYVCGCSRFPNHTSVRCPS